MTSPGIPPKRLNVLVSNDDGIEYDGIVGIVTALHERGHNVKVSAPMTNQSGMSHRMTLHGTMFMKKHVFNDQSLAAVEAIKVQGTPVDCIQVGLQFFKEFVPDVVVSGINLGSNAGIASLYSGTVGAAAEGAAHGIPAVALSADIPWDVEIEKSLQWSLYGRALVDYVELCVASTIPRFHFVSINFPFVPDGHDQVKAQLTAASYGKIETKYEFEKDMDGHVIKVKKINIVPTKDLIRCEKAHRLDTVALKEKKAVLVPMATCFGVNVDRIEAEARNEWIKRLETVFQAKF